jgi:LysR family transcriptional regulator, regulatory protein for tcuABC
VIVPRASTLVAPERVSLTLQELAALPLVLPSPGHGLRRRIALELERVNLAVDAVAEIDSLPLLMHCVAAGIGATIKPMAAIHALDDRPERWRCLRVSDAAMQRTNYLYALPTEKLSPCAAVVREELKRVVQRLVENGEWQGVRLCETPAHDETRGHAPSHESDAEVHAAA